MGKSVKAKKEKVADFKVIVCHSCYWTCLLITPLRNQS